MRLLKTVFHVHTDHSDDSNNTVEHLLECAHRWEIDCLTITDHDTIEGARAVAAAAGPNLRVIIGEEISTREGHLIGLFLHEHVGPGRSARETAKAIRQQGGLVVVPHPFISMFSCGLRRAVHGLVDLIDAVEIANAQNLSPFPDRKARRFAARHGLPGLAGADSHHRNSLRASYQWLPEFDGPESFLAAVRQAELVPGRHTLGYFVRSAWLITRVRLGFGTPADYGRRCTTPRPNRRARPLTVSVEPLER